MVSLSINEAHFLQYLSTIFVSLLTKAPVIQRSPHSPKASVGIDTILIYYSKIALFMISLFFVASSVIRKSAFKLDKMAIVRILACVEILAVVVEYADRGIGGIIKRCS